MYKVYYESDRRSHPTELGHAGIFEGAFRIMSKEFEQIESYEERFGNIAIAKGFITPKELLNALKIQVKEETESRKHRLIGQILLEEGVISGEEIEQVLADLFRKGNQDL